jgi:hypothetical protein
MSTPNGAPPSGEQPSATPPVDIVAELKKTTEALSAQINQVKAEFNRKIDSVRAPAQAPAPKRSFEEEFYEDADRAISTKLSENKNQTVEEVFNALDRRDKARETQNRLYGEFPELQDVSSPLYKKADEIYRSFGIPEGQLDPQSLRAAVNEAALDLGVVPKSKRQKEASSDEFTGLGGGNSRPSGKQPKTKVTDGMLSIAQQMGININDPKAVERLEQRAQRKNWLKYE